MTLVSVTDLQPGPQRALAETSLPGEKQATVVLYGGGRGGGKSFAAILDSAKYFDIGDYGCVIFRRTSPELRGTGSIWEDTTAVYPHIGGDPTETKLLWKFPSGAQIQLSHLQHETDSAKWQGRNLARIVFDEAQHFEPSQFWFLLSCLRSKCPVFKQFICTFNPDPDSWLMPFVQPYLDEQGFPIREMSGVVRWFGRIKGKLETFASKQEGEALGCDGLKSYTYIPALLYDNPALLRKDPEYLSTLKALPPVQRAQFLDGCWLAAKGAGDLFQQAWFPTLIHGTLARRSAGQPDDREIVRWVLCGDLAATAVEGNLVPGCPVDRHTSTGRDPDWTRLLLLGQFRDGRIVVWDMQSFRDVPGAIEWAIVQLAKRAPRGTTVVLTQDPGQQGVHQMESYQKALRGIARFESTRPLNPIYMATYASRVVFKGLVYVRDPDIAPWTQQFFRELEGYSSDGSSSTRHDDIVSALGTGLVYLASKPSPRVDAVLPSLDGEMSRENNIHRTPSYRVM